MKKKERLLWAFKWKGCKAVDPGTLKYTRREVEQQFLPLALKEEVQPGKIVRVALREV